tara:strand:- start:174 stop:515 length:342 start_codon:yes stop_codon:yes gene_type:complete
METVITLWWILFAVSLFGIFAWLWYKRITHSNLLLQRWVTKNGYILIKSKREFFRKGPYGKFKSGRNHDIFRITVLDSQNSSHMGWVRCGSFFKGSAFSNDVEGVLDKDIHDQ